MTNMLSEIRISLPNTHSSPMMKMAYENAKNSGIPEVLLNRQNIIVTNYTDSSNSDMLKLEEISPSSDLFFFALALRFSLPDALLKRFNFLTSKMYISQIPYERISEYAYYVIAYLYSDEAKYDFLEKEISEIEKQIEATGAYTTARSDFTITKQMSGTFAEHLVACNFLLGLNKTFKVRGEDEGNMIDNKALHEVVSIINHLPLISQFQARSRYISSPSVRFEPDWRRFIFAGENLLSIVFNIYTSLHEDYWKTYYFFINNDICEIAKVTTFSDIDEEVVDNWVEIPKSFLNNDDGNYVSVENLNYLKWDYASRY